MGCNHGPRDLRAVTTIAFCRSKGQLQACFPHDGVLHRCDISERQTRIHKKIQKVFVIAKTDTTDYPRAVMIHAQEARVAHAAMVGARWFFFVAFSAPQGAAP
jgi:hypothetical protein